VTVGAVEIVRDEWGIPHVLAEAWPDAFFGQGFAAAADRLWQMEWDRRRGEGRLAELVGRPGLAADVFMRRIGLARHARDNFGRLGADAQEMLTAYAHGVNAYVSGVDTLPLEFRRLDIEMAPWEPWQCLLVFSVRHVAMGTRARKAIRTGLLKHVDANLVRRLRPNLGEELLIVPDGSRYLADERGLDLGSGLGLGLGLGLDEEIRLSLLGALAGVPVDAGVPGDAGLPGDLDGGSNNWVVAGSRTASGLPLLAGDPHRQLEVPTPYHQNHLAAPGFDAIGLSFPGVPGLPHFGHNSHVAWCITHGCADDQDLFVEQSHPDDRASFRYEGGWEQGSRSEETVYVRGEDPVAVEIRSSRHGSLIAEQGDVGLAFAWTATAAPDASFDSLLPMLRARSADELCDAMSDWVVPCNNLLAADTDGAIRYLFRGRLARRDAANGWAAVPGWDSRHDWQGFVPFAELPRQADPPSGVLVTANNRPAAPPAPYIGIDFSGPSRAGRVRSHLVEGHGLDRAAMERIHADEVSLVARRIVAALPSLAPQDAVEAAAWEALQSWDATMGSGSVGAAVYMALRAALTRRLSAALGLTDASQGLDVLRAAPLAAEWSGFEWQALGSLLAEGVDAADVGGAVTPLVADALADAVKWLRDTLGDDLSTWTWGRLHTIGWLHPLNVLLPELDLPMPPSPSVGGDGDTVHCTAPVGTVDFVARAASVARYVFDLGDWEGSGWVVPPGVSGDADSPHHLDQLATWTAVELVPMRYDWAAIRRAATTVQTVRALG